MSARKIVTPEQKVAILREHLIEKVPVSQVCDKHGVSVVYFYNWQKQFFENGAAAIERKPNSASVKRQVDANQARIEVLEAKLQQKNEVIAELLQDPPAETPTSLRNRFLTPFLQS